MSRDNLVSNRRVRGQPPYPGDGSRSTPIRAYVPALGSWSVLAALIVGGAYLAGSPPDLTAERIALAPSAGDTRAIAFGPGDQRLVATMHDQEIRCWRIGAGSGRATSSDFTAPGHAAAFAPNGTTLAVGGDSAVSLGEAAPNRSRRVLPTADGFTYALSFSRDGRFLAVAGERGVSLWDVASDGERAVTRIGLRGVFSLAFGLDGRSLITGGRDGFVRFWDIEASRCRLAVRTHTLNVTARWPSPTTAERWPPPLTAIERPGFWTWSPVVGSPSWRVTRRLWRR